MVPITVDFKKVLDAPFHLFLYSKLQEYGDEMKFVDV